MRVLSCHIENFGKLHDLDLDFREGLHPILEENGWGKSTLAAFLLTMFYGFANEKKRSLLENDRKRYAPWQNGAYGGSVTFAWNEQHIRLERFFGNRDAGEDRLEAYDAETNLPISGFSSVPGEAIFRIDRESFCRTVFVAQQDCATQATSGIQAKIGHLEEESADLADYKSVQDKIKKNLDQLNPNRSTGEINKLNREIAFLQSRLDRRPQQEETLQRLTEQKEEQSRKQKEIEARMDAQTEQLRQLSVSREKASVQSLSEQEAQRLEELDATFRAGMPGEEELEEAEACLKESRRLRAAFDRVSFQPEAEKEEPRPKTTPLMALVFMLFASSIMAFFMYRILAAVLLGAAILIMILKTAYDKKHGIEDPKTVVRDPVTWDRLTKSLRKGKELEAKRAEILEMEQELLTFLQEYYPDLTQEDDLSRRLQQLQYECTEYRLLLEKETRAREAEESYQHDQEDARGMLWQLVGEEPVSPEELQRALEEGKEEKARLEQAVRGSERQIEELGRELEQLNETEEQLLVRTEEREEKQKQYVTLSTTSRYLSEARARFTARYMEPIKRSFDSYYALLSGGDEKEYQLDADLNIKAREQGALRETGFLSEGYQDLIGLCRRMAMIDAMYEEERPFLLLDDPFVNLDEDKLHRAMDFLQKVAERYQIIYCTCHKSRIP